MDHNRIVIKCHIFLSWLLVEPFGDMSAQTLFVNGKLVQQDGGTPLMTSCIESLLYWHSRFFSDALFAEKNVPFSSSASQLHDKPSTTKGSDRLFLKRRFKTTIQIKYYVYVISTIILLSHLVACMYYHRCVCQVAAKWRCFRIIKGRNDKPSLFLLKDVAATKCRLAIYEEISFPGQPTTKFQPSHVMYEQRNTFHEESRFNHSVKTNDNLKEHCRDDVVDAIKHLNYRAGTSVLSDWQCVVWHFCTNALISFVEQRPSIYPALYHTYTKYEFYEQHKCCITEYACHQFLRCLPNFSRLESILTPSD